MAVTTAATFCATLVDEWVAAGLTTAMVAPGSRSTPVALALADHPTVAVHVFHDERSAAFAALGHGLVTGRAAVVLCSSGTAATHFHAAVVEADLSGVPMLVVTADRPPELHDVGAAQTIDQTRLYGRAVRWFHDPGAPSEDSAGSWRSLARRAWRATLGADPGPVHLNLAFREPLVGEAGPLPGGAAPDPLDVTATTSLDVTALARVLEHQRGVIVVGRGLDGAVGELDALAAATGWPVFADPRSGARGLGSAVTTADDLLRHADFARDHTPEVVLHVGEPWASRIVNEWLARSGAVHVHVSSRPRPLDPGLVIAHWVTAPVAPTLAALATVLTGATGTTWPKRWEHAERSARAAIASVVGGDGPLTEPGVARSVTEVVAGWEGGRLVVSSSMPIRDVEWYTSTDLAVVSNRGANGIDGVLATGIGVAIGTGAPVAVLIGDVAFLHDATSLTALARRGLDVRIVVTDNDGGAIFSFLPQATAVPAARFEQLYGTPHGTDLALLAAAHGLSAARVGTAGELREALERPGPSVTIVPSDRAANVQVHDAIHRAVRAAL